MISPEQENQFKLQHQFFKHEKPHDSSIKELTINEKEESVRKAQEILNTSNKRSSIALNVGILLMFLSVIGCVFYKNNILIIISILIFIYGLYCLLSALIARNLSKRKFTSINIIEENGAVVTREVKNHGLEVITHTLNVRKRK